MLNHNNDLFDLIKGEKKPIKVFGDTFIEQNEIRIKFNKVKEEAYHRFNEMFLGIKKEISAHILEQTIQKMWNEGWQPEKGNINLFATDFGAILTNLITKKMGGKFVFRSEQNLIDLSLWWSGKKIEAFPFHKIYKRLSSKEGDDIEYFFNQIEKILK